MNDLPSAEREKAVCAGNPAYEPHMPNLPAELIYFYYLKITGNPREETRVFVIDRQRHIPPDQMQAQIQTILGEIGQGLHKPVGWKIGDVKWRRKSYLVFVLDDAQHSLETCNAVEFIFQDAGGGNHTFRDGHDTQPFPAPYQNVSGFYCLNHMGAKNGGDVSLPEEFEVKVHHPHALASGKRTHDDTGTNMGPPVGPP